MPQIHALFRILKERGGSDLHLSPGNPPLCRVTGSLIPIGSQALTHETNTLLLYEIMNPHQKQEFNKTMDVDFAYAVPDMDCRFRVNVFYGHRGISAVLRLVPTHIPTVQEIGLPETVVKLANLNKGLILVTGATGSGKSTTLAALINHINQSRNEHILTIEDPIEFIHASQKSLINQREVGVHTLSFAGALRAALREDPDVIMLGEMRDLETIELAITAAETGHLVLGTLHTSTAAKSVDRLINVFPTNQQPQIRVMLAESLKGIIAQNLLKAVDDRLMAAMEVLVVTPAVSALIRDGKTHQIPGVMQTGRKEGMQLMNEAVKILVDRGCVTSEEAAKYLIPEFIDPPPADYPRRAIPVSPFVRIS